MSESDWNSFFFELLTIRTCQILGAKVQCEALANAKGKRIDVKAEFSSSTVLFEAVAPKGDKDTYTLQRELQEVQKIINDSIPKGWVALLGKEPAIGSNDSKANLKKAMIKLADTLHHANEYMEVPFCESFGDNGELELLLIRVAESPGGLWGDAGLKPMPEGLIAKAFKAKHDQVSGQKYPVILAVYLGGIVDKREVARELYGELIEERDGSKRCVYLKARGLFACGDCKIAGVLFYYQIDYCFDNPVLFINPRFEAMIPTELRVLETFSMRCDEIVHSENTHESICKKMLATSDDWGKA